MCRLHLLPSRALPALSRPPAPGSVYWVHGIDRTLATRRSIRCATLQPDRPIRIRRRRDTRTEAMGGNRESSANLELCSAIQLPGGLTRPADRGLRLAVADDTVLLRLASLFGGHGDRLLGEFRKLDEVLDATVGCARWESSSSGHTVSILLFSRYGQRHSSWARRRTLCIIDGSLHEFWIGHLRRWDPKEIINI